MSPPPKNVLAFAVDVYYGPCCVAQEHANHVERLAPEISSIFLFTAPWHCWPARLPAAVMLEVKQTQPLVWQVSTHVRISLLWASTLFFFFKWRGSSPHHQHLDLLHCVSGQMMNHSWIATTGKGGGVLNIGQTVKTELQSENKSYLNSNHH